MVTLLSIQRQVMEEQGFVGGVDEAGFTNLSSKQKQRYNAFVEAWYKNLDNEPSAALYQAA